MTAIAQTLCETIEGLTMAFLDGELASEEQRELELHLCECSSCRAYVESEQQALASIRDALSVQARVPDLLQVKIRKALDKEAQQEVRAAHRQWVQRWAFPGAAIIAAAAALAFFVMGQPHRDDGRLAHEAHHQQQRAAPLEVVGASTAPWLREHFTPSVALPQFPATTATLTGARLTVIAGHDAAQLFYDVQLATRASRANTALTAFVIRGIAPNELPPGDDIQVGNQTLRVSAAGGHPSVSVMVGDLTFLFIARDLTAAELLEVVTRADLVKRASVGE